jgi:hypothetical protein
MYIQTLEPALSRLTEIGNGIPHYRNLFNLICVFSLTIEADEFFLRRKTDILDSFVPAGAS